MSATLIAPTTPKPKYIVRKGPEMWEFVQVNPPKDGKPGLEIVYLKDTDGKALAFAGRIWLASQGVIIPQICTEPFPDKATW